MTRRKVSDLIGEAKALRTTLTAAREEVIRLASDPFADPAAVRRATNRLAYLTGVGRGWASVVDDGLRKHREGNDARR